MDWARCLTEWEVSDECINPKDEEMDRLEIRGIDEAGYQK